MIFLDLPEDVVHEALCLCDIASVLSISEVQFVAIHRSYFLLRTLVEDLRHRGFIDRLTATDIRSMSAQSLVAIVRRLVVGPEAWSPPRFQSTPFTPFSRIFGKSSRPRRKPAPLGPDSSLAQPCAHIVLNSKAKPLKVFPGGKYALFRSADDPEILKWWRTADNPLLGTYRSTIPSSIVDFAAEVLHSGERRRQHIRVCSIDSLSDSCLLLEDHTATDPVRLSNIPHVALTSIELKGAPARYEGLAVHENPLQRGTYRVWLYTQYSETRRLRSAIDRALLYRFRLTLPAAGQFAWREQRCTPVERALGVGGISYSAHTAKPYWSRGPLASILPPEIQPAPVVVATPHPMEASWGMLRRITAR
ncbi:hypothetical protein C8R44DRAFT_883047 [Mycena epipterygia]|nr:hypothetical protein C8R44DRAFT_883047 [Mycena epipterygia]